MIIDKQPRAFSCVPPIAQHCIGNGTNARQSGTSFNPKPTSQTRLEALKQSIISLGNRIFDDKFSQTSNLRAEMICAGSQMVPKLIELMDPKIMEEYDPDDSYHLPCTAVAIAIQILKTDPDKKSTELLLNELEKSINGTVTPGMLEYVMGALEHSPYPELTFPYLERLLNQGLELRKDGLSEHKAEGTMLAKIAIGTLGEVGDLNCVQLLLPLLSEPSKELRGAAKNAIVKWSFGPNAIKKARFSICTEIFQSFYHAQGLQRQNYPESSLWVLAHGNFKKELEIATRRCTSFDHFEKSILTGLAETLFPFSNSLQKLVLNSLEEGNPQYLETAFHALHVNLKRMPPGSLPRDYQADLSKAIEAIFQRLPYGQKEEALKICGYIRPPELVSSIAARISPATEPDQHKRNLLRSTFNDSQSDAQVKQAKFIRDADALVLVLDGTALSGGVLKADIQEILFNAGAANTAVDAFSDIVNAISFLTQHGKKIKYCIYSANGFLKQKNNWNMFTNALGRLELNFPILAVLPPDLKIDYLQSEGRTIKPISSLSLTRIMLKEFLKNEGILNSMSNTKMQDANAYVSNPLIQNEITRFFGRDFKVVRESFGAQIESIDEGEYIKAHSNIRTRLILIEPHEQTSYIAYAGLSNSRITLVGGLNSDSKSFIPALNSFRIVYGLGIAGEKGVARTDALPKRLNGALFHMDVLTPEMQKYYRHFIANRADYALLFIEESELTADPLGSNAEVKK